MTISASATMTTGDRCLTVGRRSHQLSKKRMQTTVQRPTWPRTGSTASRPEQILNFGSPVQE
jgi:hypothetical protein